MKKLFEIWNQLKQTLSKKERPIPYFYEREVWFCHIGKNIGFEQDGKGVDFRRPVLVLKKFGPFGSFGLPLPSNKKNGNWFHNLKIPVGKVDKSCILLLQGRFFSSSRLSHKLGSIPLLEFQIIQKKIANLYCDNL